MKNAKRSKPNSEISEQTGRSIDAMVIVQKHRGWVSDEALNDIGELLGMSTTDLDGVATFYNLIWRKPVGNMSR